MRKILVLMCGLISFVSFNLVGQNKGIEDLIQEIEERNNAVKASKKKEIGINMTTLFTQFIPFNESVRKSGPFTLTYRSGTATKMFNLQVGADINDFDTDRYFNLAMGIIKRKILTDKYSYYMSYNGLISFGSLNIPTDSFRDFTSIGGGIGFGFEYNFNQYIGLGVETMLTLLVSDDGALLSTLPPIGLNLMIRFQ